jgi:hypothetical protein
VVASKDGFVTRTENPTLMPGTDTLVELEMVRLEAAVKTVRRWHVATPWSVLGAGVLVGLAGVPLILKAKDDYAEYDKKFGQECAQGCTPDKIPGSVKDIEERAKAEHYSSIALFALGGAGIATGIVLVILNQPRKVKVDVPTTNEPPPVSVSPLPGSGGMVTTRFSF